MNKSNFIVVALALLLTACATPRDSRSGDGEKVFNLAVVRRPSLCNVVVFVVLGQIVMDQEPVITVPNTCGTLKRTDLAFHLDPDAKTTFPADDAIVFKVNPPGNPKCRTSEKDRQSVTCSFDRPNTPTNYKYSVTVDGAGTLDPTIFAN